MTHSPLYSKSLSINIYEAILNWNSIDKNLVALSTICRSIGFRETSQLLGLGHTSVLKKEMMLGREDGCGVGREERESLPFLKRQENEMDTKIWMWGLIPGLQKRQVWFNAESKSVRTLFLKSILLWNSNLG